MSATLVVVPAVSTVPKAYWAADQNKGAYEMPVVKTSHHPYIKRTAIYKVDGGTKQLTVTNVMGMAEEAAKAEVGERFDGAPDLLLEESRTQMRRIEDLAGIQRNIVFAGPAFSSNSFATLTKIPAAVPRNGKCDWVAKKHKVAAVAKVAVGQVPFHVTDQQLAYILWRATEAGPDAPGVNVLAIEAMMHKGGGGRTGLRFVFVEASQATSLLLLNRLVLFTSTDAYVFQRDHVAVPLRWCHAVRAMTTCNETANTIATPRRGPLEQHQAATTATTPEFLSMSSDSSASSLTSAGTGSPTTPLPPILQPNQRVGGGSQQRTRHALLPMTAALANNQ